MPRHRRVVTSAYGSAAVDFVVEARPGHALTLALLSVSKTQVQTQTVTPARILRMSRLMQGDKCRVRAEAYNRPASRLTLLNTSHNIFAADTATWDNDNQMRACLCPFHGPLTGA